jgi:hypothetical protein
MLAALFNTKERAEKAMKTLENRGFNRHSMTYISENEVIEPDYSTTSEEDQVLAPNANVNVVEPIQSDIDLQTLLLNNGVKRKQKRRYLESALLSGKHLVIAKTRLFQKCVAKNILKVLGANGV